LQEVVLNGKRGLLRDTCDDLKTTCTKTQSAWSLFDKHHTVEIILNCNRNREQERSRIAKIDILICIKREPCR